MIDTTTPTGPPDASAAPEPTATPRRTDWLAEIRGLIGLALMVIGFHSLVAQPFYIPSESMMPGLLVGDRIVVAKYPYGWSYASPSFPVLPFLHGRLFGRLPERGDVAILTPPGAGRRGEAWIKRVIGLPGDTVQMIAGRLWLNGRPVVTRDMGYRTLPVDGNMRCELVFPGPAPANDDLTTGNGPCRVHVVRETLPNGRSYDTLDLGRSGEDDTPLYRVPANHVFVMGDNRDNSADSRVPLTQNGLNGAIPIENLGGRAEFISFSLNGTAGWNPLSWLPAFRGDRFGRSLRPQAADR